MSRPRPITSRCTGSPYGNELLLDFAVEALEREKLGQRGATDLLSVSFSSNDSVGHTHGPDSPHVRDIAIRTDRVIGGLLRARRSTRRAVAHHRGADRRPWRGAAAGSPAAAVAAGRTAREQGSLRPDPGGDGRGLRRGPWILSTAGSSPYFNYELIAERKLIRRTYGAWRPGAPPVSRT